MAHQFNHHYTRDEARALLPSIRQWLGLFARSRHRFVASDEILRPQLAAGQDLGGEYVEDWVRSLCEIKQVLREFQTRDIQVKDLDRGLIDFPAIIGGREVFLCWELDEEDIEFWHDLDTGYAGREPL